MTDSDQQELDFAINRMIDEGNPQNEDVEFAQPDLSRFEQEEEDSLNTVIEIPMETT